MTTQTYSGSKAADVQAILSNIPVSTKNHIIQALQANGLFRPNATLQIDSVINPTNQTEVARGTQAVLLGAGSATVVNSARPVIIGLDSGKNYVIAGSHGASSRGDTIIGGSGQDAIFGSTGADSLVAGAGNERLVSGGGKDTLRGGSGPDTLRGGGQSMILAGSGPTTIRAGFGSDGYADTPRDTIQAGTGRDNIILGSGNNVVYAPTAGGKATISAGSGHDTIYGPTAFQGTETVNSGGQTTLNMGTGSVTYNLKSGNGSNDTIFGGSNGGASYVDVNRSAATITNTTLGGQSAKTYTFAGGGTITATGNVNIIFKPNS